MVSSLTRKIDERGEYVEFECVHCNCDKDYGLKEAEELGARFECPFCDGVNDGFASGGLVDMGRHVAPLDWLPAYEPGRYSAPSANTVVGKLSGPAVLLTGAVPGKHYRANGQNGEVLYGTADENGAATLTERGN